MCSAPLATTTFYLAHLLKGSVKKMKKRLLWPLLCESPKIPSSSQLHLPTVLLLTTLKHSHMWSWQTHSCKTQNLSRSMLMWQWWLPVARRYSNTRELLVAFSWRIWPSRRPKHTLNMSTVMSAMALLSQPLWHLALKVIHLSGSPISRTLQSFLSTCTNLFGLKLWRFMKSKKVEFWLIK